MYKKLKKALKEGNHLSILFLIQKIDIDKLTKKQAKTIYDLMLENGYKPRKENENTI